MKIIHYLLRNAWGIVAFAIAAGVISGLSSAGLLAVINGALTNDGASPGLLAWSFAGLCLTVLVARVVSEVLLIRLGQGVILDLRMHLSRQILAAPLRHLQALGSPRLLATLTEDVVTITDAFEWIPHLFINGAIVAGCLIYLGWLSWPLLLVALGFMALGVLSFQIPKGKALGALKLAREHDDALYARFRALTEGIKELKLHRPRREAFLSQALGATARACRDHFVSGMTVFTIATHWGNLLFYVFIGLVMFAVPAFLAIAPQVMIGYTLVIFYMMGPLADLLNGLPVLGRASIALKKVDELGLSLKAHVERPDTAEPPPAPFKSPLLEFSGVTHHYRRDGDDRGFTLGPIDLTLSLGELIYVVGGNGSGKTTLAMLLVGLYAPEGGEIRLNGRPVTDESREHYRQHFSAVFADNYLFDSLLGLCDPALDARARDYLTHLQLDHKVKIENGVFSTVDLSQGQRKRLALLTAYLEGRPFYLFDEWAAGQDPMFKELFYTELLPKLRARGKTVVAITHDDRYFHLADRVIKLEDGRLMALDSAAGFPTGAHSTGTADQGRDSPAVHALRTESSS